MTYNPVFAQDIRSLKTNAAVHIAIPDRVADYALGHHLHAWGMLGLVAYGTY